MTRPENCYCYRTWNLCPPCEEAREAALAREELPIRREVLEHLEETLDQIARIVLDAEDDQAASDAWDLDHMHGQRDR